MLNRTETGGYVIKLIHTNQYGDKFYAGKDTCKVELADGSVGIGNNFCTALIHAYRVQEVTLYGHVRSTLPNFLRK